MTIQRTIASYDEIAGDYLERWRDRAVMEREIAWREETFGQRAPRYFAYWEADALDRALRAAGFEIVEARRSELASIWLSRIVVK